MRRFASINQVAAVWLMDIREPEEFEVCHIDRSILVPFSEFKEQLCISQ